MNSNQTGVYIGQPHNKITGTKLYLQYLRKFVRSDFAVTKDPDCEFGVFIDRDQAQERLNNRLNVAINRKAGIKDEPGRKYTVDYQARLLRDCIRIRDKIQKRIIIHHLETDEMKKRYGHLITNNAVHMGEWPWIQ